MNDYPESVKIFCDFWRLFLAQKIVIVCFKEGSDDIVALNFIGVQTIEDTLPKGSDLAYPFSELQGAFEMMIEDFQVMDYYKVDKYLTALYVFYRNIEDKELQQKCLEQDILYVKRLVYQSLHQNLLD